MIGVLALQGAFAEHEAVLTGLGYSYTEVRQRSHLTGDLDAMILPGGESTVMNKLLNDLGMFDELKAMIEEGLPVFGTCAGLILLSKRVEGGSPSLATMDIDTVRNAYGRQLGSFSCNGSFAGKEIPIDTDEIHTCTVRGDCRSRSPGPFGNRREDSCCTRGQTARHRIPSRIDRRYDRSQILPGGNCGLISRQKQIIPFSC